MSNDTFIIETYCELQEIKTEHFPQKKIKNTKSINRLIKTNYTLISSIFRNFNF